MNRDYTYSIPWNLLLITLGSCIYAVSIKSIATVHGFIPGGIFGLGALVYYKTHLMDPATWYFLLNIPLFAMGWFKVSKRFCLYSLYAMCLSTVAYKVLNVPIHIENEFYATVASGVLSGLGSGLILRSLGSGGGMDIVAIMLNQKYNVGVGKTFFAFNLFLFSLSLSILKTDLVVASIINVFIAATTMDSVLSLFNQRKVVFIISDKAKEIANEIMTKLQRSGTFLEGKGAYTGQNRDVLMTVINNIQLKKLEEITFTCDPNAFFIVENTFSVLGQGFSRRKVY